MVISDFSPSVSDSSFFLMDWNPLNELDSEDAISPTVLIQGDNAHQYAAELIARLMHQFPNMPVFVIPETPDKAVAKIDKTTEVMTWLSDTSNRGDNPTQLTLETPIPLAYLSSVADLFEESSLARMVNRSYFLGLIVIAVATNIDPESAVYHNITKMFTHIIHV